MNIAVDDRKTTNLDNNPPEALPQVLPSAAELGAVIRNDVKEVTVKALAELDTFSRVPETIESDEIYQRVTTLATRVKQAADNAEERRKDHKAPYLAAAKLIDDNFSMPVTVENGKDRNLKKELEAAYASLKKRLSAYDTKKFLAEQAAAEAEREKLAKAAAKDGIELAPEANSAVIASTIHSAHGGHAVRKVVTEWEVIDETLLPRSVLSIDPAKVEKLIADGATSIPGIDLSKKVNTHVKKR